MNDDECIAEARSYARTLAPQDAVHLYRLIHLLAAANADAATAWCWVDLMDTDKDKAELYGDDLDRDRDVHLARVRGGTDPRNNPEDAYRAFRSMPDSEWRGLVTSLLRGGVLTPAEQLGFDQALKERGLGK